MPWQSAGEQLAAAVVLHAATGGRSRQLPEGSDRMRRAKWRLFGLYVVWPIRDANDQEEADGGR